MNKTRIIRNKVILAEWVSLNHLSDKERRETADLIGKSVEYTLPRPDLKRQPAEQNTLWKG